MIKCQIQWIDENGKPTPDDNPATVVLSCVGSDRYFFCCAEHAERARTFPNWTIHNPMDILAKLASNKFQSYISLLLKTLMM